MNNLKNYSKPVMRMELFVPQEYCYVCWKVLLNCDGATQTGDSDHYIFINSGGSYTYWADMCETENRHLPHSELVIVRTDTEAPPTPAEVDSAILNWDFKDAVMGSASNTTHGGKIFKDGAPHTDGYAWGTAPWPVHFAADPEPATRYGAHS